MLSVKNLSISVKQKQVVRNVSFQLKKGSCMGLVGESGSGKSLTALSVMGLLPKLIHNTGEKILFKNTDLLLLPEKAMRKIRGQNISMILQEPMTALNPVMHCGKQVVEIILQHQHVSKKEAHRQTLSLFEKVKIPRPEKIFYTYPYQISGGQKQRIMIAMALANHPDILITDEPATLDDFLNPDNVITFHPETETEEDRKKRLEILYRQPLLLKAEKLTKAYPFEKSWRGKTLHKLKAVNKVSFDVFPGETLGLVGESGCGKTTLGRSLLQFIEPTSSRIYFEERELLSLSRKALRPFRKKTGIVFQNPYSSLNQRISIGKAIMEEPMQVHHLYKNNTEQKQKTLELMVKTGLKPEHFHRYPHEFSGGQRQRIVIARTLTLQPRFIICDEAVSLLDISVQATILNLLNRLKAEFGFTYIFISHDLSVVRFMSDRIIVIKEGKIVETGNADEIYFHPQQPYPQNFIATIPTLQNQLKKNNYGTKKKISQKSVTRNYCQHLCRQSVQSL